MVNTLPCQGRDRGFEPRHFRQCDTFATTLTVEGEKSGKFGSWLHRYDPIVVNDDLVEY